MKIYKMEKDVNNYKGCYLVNEDIIDKIRVLFSSGKRILEKIKFLDFKYDDSDNSVGDICECFDLSVCIVNKKCKEIFDTFNKFNVQYIDYSDDFIIMNNLNVVDVLDKDKTVFKIVNDDILGVKKFCFRTYDYPMLFQVSLPNGIILRDYFVTEEFIKIVEENDLKGFLFEEVWDSEKE